MTVSSSQQTRHDLGQFGQEDIDGVHAYQQANPPLASPSDQRAGLTPLLQQMEMRIGEHFQRCHDAYALRIAALERLVDTLVIRDLPTVPTFEQQLAQTPETPGTPETTHSMPLPPVPSNDHPVYNAYTLGKAIAEDLGKYSGDCEITIQQFISKVNIVANHYGAKHVAYHLPKALIGKAQVWYMEHEQDIEALSQNLEDFKDALIRRFAMSLTEAADQILQEHYTLKDAKNRRDPGDYVRKIIRLSRLAGWSQDAALQRAWIQISPRLAGNFLQPLPNSSVNEFIDTLDRVKLRWFDEAPRFNTGQPPGPQRYVQPSNSTPKQPPRPQQQPCVNRNRMQAAPPQQPWGYHEDEDYPQQVYLQVNNQDAYIQDAYDQEACAQEVYNQEAYDQKPCYQQANQAALDLRKYNITARQRDGIPAFSCGHCNNKAFTSLHAIRGHAKQVHGHHPDRIGW